MVILTGRLNGGVLLYLKMFSYQKLLWQIYTEEFSQRGWDINNKLYYVMDYYSHHDPFSILRTNYWSVQTLPKEQQIGNINFKNVKYIL